MVARASGSFTVRSRKGAHTRHLNQDGSAIGGFYESIMALMIVTAGIVLLTTSFTLMSVDGGTGDKAAERTCDQVMDRLLNDPALAPSARILDNRSLSHVDIRTVSSNWSGGMRVMLTFSDAPSMVLYDSGGSAATDRACRSEPVNLRCRQNDVKAALLTVWVWR